VPDEVVEISVDVRAHLDAKRAALVAHATQVTVRGGFLALSNDIGMVLAPVEHYRVVRTADGIAAPAPDDLLAGLVTDR
jgi:N-acetyl-1-D-myo-inositol-2-amino-2-deoxy-alpha-D-glucopyranoside deacetylase